MKRYQILLTILFVLVAVKWCEAAFYIVNQDNKVVAKTNYRPSQADLDTRGEIAVETTEDIVLMEAEYRGGKVVKHKETTGEIAVKNKHKNKKDDMALIRNKLNYMACLALELEGVTFKNIKCKDFE